MKRKTLRYDLLLTPFQKRINSLRIKKNDQEKVAGYVAQPMGIYDLVLFRAFRTSAVRQGCKYILQVLTVYTTLSKVAKSQVQVLYLLTWEAILIKLNSKKFHNL